jgi:hypothetical protein
MMKKLALAALAAFTLVGVAQAQVSSPARWTFEDVRFRSNAAANPAPGYIDSLTASGAAKFDTTVAIATAGWAPVYGGSAVDSAVVCRLMVFDAQVTGSRTSTTAESIYVKTQVSPDGMAWFDCAVIPGQAPVLNAFTVQTTVNAAVLTFTNSTNTGISDKMWSVRFVAAQSAPGGKVIPDINSLHTFPYVRFILSGSRSLVHNWRARIGFPLATQR